MSGRDLVSSEPRGSWIQTERSAHEAWAHFLLLKGAVGASRVMHMLLAKMGQNNAVVISQKTLAELLGCDVRTVRRGVDMLRRHNWVEVRQIGDRGTVNGYIVNDRVGWYGDREKLRFSLFSANVVVSADEQPDKDELGRQKPLNRVPEMHRGERQLPSGPGLPPPSQPSLSGLEPDLPARQIDIEDAINNRMK